MLFQIEQEKFSCHRHFKYVVINTLIKLVPRFNVLNILKGFFKRPKENTTNFIQKHDFFLLLENNEFTII